MRCNESVSFLACFIILHDMIWPTSFLFYCKSTRNVVAIERTSVDDDGAVKLEWDRPVTLGLMFVWKCNTGSGSPQVSTISISRSWPKIALIGDTQTRHDYNYLHDHDVVNICKKCG
jgi:hypothetical protein